LASDPSAWISSRTHQRLDNSSTCCIDENREGLSPGAQELFPPHIEKLRCRVTE
jgi:hypothetical protein